MESNNVQQPQEVAKIKPWYKKWWGVLLVILIWPFFIIWYVWAKTKLSNGLKILISIPLVIFILVAISPSKPATDTSTTTKNEPTQAQPVKEVKKELTPEEKAAQEAEQAKKDAEEKTKQEALAKPHFGDGNFVVGADIQPGTYRTRTGSDGCYYARLKGFGGSVDDIISNENTSAPAVITISPSDKGFTSTRCGTWTQDLSAITTDQTTFGDGVLIVGTDIQSGTYKNSGSDGCYYARLKGFGNGNGDIISNDNTDNSAIVTIGSGDKGFKSERCGTWKKI